MLVNMFDFCILRVYTQQQTQKMQKIRSVELNLSTFRGLSI